MKVDFTEAAGLWHGVWVVGTGCRHPFLSLGVVTELQQPRLGRTLAVIPFRPRLYRKLNNKRDDWPRFLKRKRRTRKRTWYLFWMFCLHVSPSLSQKCQWWT